MPKLFVHEQHQPSFLSDPGADFVVTLNIFPREMENPPNEHDPKNCLHSTGEAQQPLAMPFG